MFQERVLHVVGSLCTARSGSKHVSLLVFNDVAQGNVGQNEDKCIQANFQMSSN